MPRSPMIDGEAERARLQALVARGTPQLVLLYGRRRVGKTYLLNNVWPAERVFYFTAAETTEQQNRETLVRELAGWLGEPLRPDDHATWRTTFRALLEARAPEPLVVVLDEFQYLGADARALGEVASQLNAVWEGRRSPRPLVLVLSGSAVRPLEALNEGGAPLYGRFAWVCKLHPFDY